MIELGRYLPEIISMVIGSIISLATSWYFYKKTDFPAKVTSAMTDDILFLLVSSRFEADFNYSHKVLKSELPNSKSVPHIVRYWQTEQSIKPGQDIIFIFRIQDTDFDFSHDDGMEIIEMESNVSFAYQRLGHGYYSSVVYCSKTATKGLHTLKINLKDIKGNHHTHLMKFEVL